MILKSLFAIKKSLLSINSSLLMEKFSGKIETKEKPTSLFSKLFRTLTLFVNSYVKSPPGYVFKKSIKK